MTTKFSLQGLKGVLLMAALFFCASATQAKITPKDTVAPNEFYFTTAEYVVSEDETNAVITVGFRSGNRGWSGAVNYRTSDGTAIDGQDYTKTTGTLYFSGYAPKTFTVPIHMDAADETNETILLTLEWEGAIIPQSNAVLRITNVKPQPALQIRPGVNQTLNISWADDGTDLILEKAANCLSEVWVQVTSPQTKANGRCTVNDATEGKSAFYRLRKAE